MLSETSRFKTRQTSRWTLSRAPSSKFWAKSSGHLPPRTGSPALGPLWACDSDVWRGAARGLENPVRPEAWLEAEPRWGSSADINDKTIGRERSRLPRDHSVGIGHSATIFAGLCLRRSEFVVAVVVVVFKARPSRPSPGVVYPASQFFSRINWLPSTFQSSWPPSPALLCCARLRQSLLSRTASSRVLLSTLPPRGTSSPLFPVRFPTHVLVRGFIY